MLFFLASTVLFIAGLLAIYWIHTRYFLDVIVQPRPDLEDQLRAAEAPLISICIPARNEQQNIRASVGAALAQSYPNLEVVVLDDRSTDATLQILDELASADPRLRVLHGAELPPGWAGKPHALHQAARAARGSWLCFVDADTYLDPQAIGACHRRAVETSADLFTILTAQLTGTFWERVVMPVVMTALSVGFPPRAVNDPRRKKAIANGQFILIRREVYMAIGGHASVKGEIVEDKAIAERVKWAGHRLVIADGTAVARTRMYRSFAEMWEGWTKNIYLGLSSNPALLGLGASGGLLAVVAALFLPVWPLLGLAWYLSGGGWLALGVMIKALLVWAALLYARAAVAHSMGIPRWYALTTPLAAGIFAAMMLSSAWKVLSGQGVTWKGRKYLQAGEKQGNNTARLSS